MQRHHRTDIENVNASRSKKRKSGRNECGRTHMKGWIAPQAPKGRKSYRVPQVKTSYTR